MTPKAPRSRIGKLHLLARRRGKLQLDEVHARDGLRNGMLDLDAGVHLHEVKLALFIHQELERADGVVAGFPNRDANAFAHVGPQFFGHRDARSLFHHLLVASLQRALALT